MTEPGRELPDIALLAALDADLLDPAQAHAVRAAALTDPESAAALAALAATRAELAALPTPVVPPGVAVRWAAALDAEAAAPHEGPAPLASGTGGSGSGGNGPGDGAMGDGAMGGSGPGSDGPGGNGPGGGTGTAGTGTADSGPGTSAAGTRTSAEGCAAASNQRLARRSHGPKGPASTQRRPVSPRRRRRPLLVALLTGALIAAGTGLLTRPDPSPEPSVLTFAQVDLAALGTTVVGVRDLGALDDPTRRAGCLAAVNRGVPGDPVLGGRRVLMDGQPGVLLVLGTGILGRFRLLVVDPACGPGGGTLLAETVIGR